MGAILVSYQDVCYEATTQIDVVTGCPESDVCAIGLAGAIVSSHCCIKAIETDIVNHVSVE